MSKHPPKKLTGLGIVVTLLSVFSLLMGACGDNTATSVPATTAPAATTAATTTSAATTGAATTAAGTTKAATTAAGTTIAGTNSAANKINATGEILIYAASSLTDPFNRIKADLEASNPGLKITYSFGGSNTLRAQLEQGAKADVFASANQTEMDNALKSNLVADKGQVFARNRLVVILPKSNPGKITKLQDLANPGVKFVTAAKDVPVGGYTLTALDKMSKDPGFSPDFSTKVQANFVSQESNVKQVVSKVQLGEADAGICYLTDISASVQKDITTLDIPDQFNTLASYPISALKGAANSAGATAFVQYITGAQGQAVLKTYGFLSPSGTSGSTQGGPSVNFSLGGLVNTPGTFKLDDLKAFTKTTVTTNPLAGGTPMGEATYGGPLLYDVLQKAVVKVDASRKNDILRKVVVVTGTDGYSVAIAWGEIDPKFANKKVLVAYEQNGQPLAQKDGFARLIVPGDGAAGRYVSNVAKIEVKDSGNTPAASDRKPSTSFSLAGLVGTPGDYNLDKLKGLKSTDVTVETKDSSGNTTKATYTGVLLNDLLTSAGGLKLNASAKNDGLRKAILGIGSDGYSSIIAGGEIDPKFGNEQILVAYNKDGQPLADSDEFARLVVPVDAAAGRYVSNLVKLEVVDFSGA